LHATQVDDVVPIEGEGEAEIVVGVIDAKLLDA
jgi:hypothetical protein